MSWSMQILLKKTANSKSDIYIYQIPFLNVWIRLSEKYIENYAYTEQIPV